MTRVTDLPKDALGEILRHLICEADRVRFRSIRLDVQQALAHLAEPLTEQLPWLLCSVGGVPTFYCLQCGDGQSIAAHPVRLQSIVAEGRLFGSHEGRYVFLETGEGNVLLNLRLNKQYKLPDVAAPRDSRISYPIAMLAATLSCSPEEEYFGAALVSSLPSKFLPLQVAFWKKGDQIATMMKQHRREQWSKRKKFEDVIYHREAFYVLAIQDVIQAWSPKLQVDGSVQWSKRYFHARPEERLVHNDTVAAKYLVESRGELLMVTKITDPNSQSTVAFRMYKMVMKTADIGVGDVYINWVEDPSLDGRMFFLGRGCSRAYEVTNFPEMTEAVYFLDDQTGVRPQLGASLDNGKYSGDPPVIDSCFPSEQAESPTIPIWVLS